MVIQLNKKIPFLVSFLLYYGAVGPLPCVSVIFKLFVNGIIAKLEDCSFSKLSSISFKVVVPLSSVKTTTLLLSVEVRIILHAPVILIKLQL